MFHIGHLTVCLIDFHTMFYLKFFFTTQTKEPEKGELGRKRESGNEKTLIGNNEKVKLSP